MLGGTAMVLPSQVDSLSNLLEVLSNPEKSKALLAEVRKATTEYAETKKAAEEAIAALEKKQTEVRGQLDDIGQKETDLRQAQEKLAADQAELVQGQNQLAVEQRYHQVNKSSFESEARAFNIERTQQNVAFEAREAALAARDEKLVKAERETAALRSDLESRLDAISQISGRPVKQTG